LFVRRLDESGDFVVSSLFKRLAVLSFRLGGNPARRPPIPRTRGQKAGGCGRGGNPDVRRTFYAAFCYSAIHWAMFPILTEANSA